MSRVLEIAAGTGVVTRVLASVLPESVSIVASDLNQAMLDQAAAIGTETAGRVAPGRRHAAAVRGRSFRRGRLPVRCHVLPRQGEGVCGGASRAPHRRPPHVQRMGPDRGERVRGHGDRGARIPVPCRPASLPRSHPARLLRSADHRAGSRGWRVHRRPPDSPPFPSAAGRPPPTSRRSPFAREHRCETRSRRALPRGSAKQPIGRRTPSLGGSGRGRSTGRFRRTSSPSKGKCA